MDREEVEVPLPDIRYRGPSFPRRERRVLLVSMVYSRAEGMYFVQSHPVPLPRKWYSLAVNSSTPIQRLIGLSLENLAKCPSCYKCLQMYIDESDNEQNRQYE